MYSYDLGAAKTCFGLCFSAAVIAPKHTGKGPTYSFSVLYDLILFVLPEFQFNYLTISQCSFIQFEENIVLQSSASLLFSKSNI